MGFKLFVLAPQPPYTPVRWIGFEVRETDTIRQLKARIEHRLGIAAGEQRLLFDCAELPDGEMLGSLGLTDSSKRVHLASAADGAVRVGLAPLTHRAGPTILVEPTDSGEALRYKLVSALNKVGFRMMAMVKGYADIPAARRRTADELATEVVAEPCALDVSDVRVYYSRSQALRVAPAARANLLSLPLPCHGRAPRAC